jgi:hypothetical protein
VRISESAAMTSVLRISLWEIGEVLERASPREKMSARWELREYLKARGFEATRN